MKFSIGEFSAITSLTIKSLRLYHEKGILIPSEIDEFTQKITDSAYMYKDDEGILLHYYQDLTMVDNIFTLTLQDYRSNKSTKEIQYFDRDKNMLLWKETHTAGNDGEYILFKRCEVRLLTI